MRTDRTELTPKEAHQEKVIIHFALHGLCTVAALGFFVIVMICSKALEPILESFTASIESKNIVVNLFVIAISVIGLPRTLITLALLLIATYCSYRTWFWFQQL